MIYFSRSIKKSERERERNCISRFYCQMLSMWWKHTAHQWVSKGHQVESFPLPPCLLNVALRAHNFKAPARAFDSCTPPFILPLSFIHSENRNPEWNHQQVSSVGRSKVTIRNNCFKQSLPMLKCQSFNKSFCSTKDQLNFIIIFSSLCALRSQLNEK